MVLASSSSGWLGGLETSVVGGFADLGLLAFRGGLGEEGISETLVERVNDTSPCCHSVDGLLMIVTAIISMHAIWEASIDTNTISITIN